MPEILSEKILKCFQSGNLAEARHHLQEYAGRVGRDENYAMMKAKVDELLPEASAAPASSPKAVAVGELRRQIVAKLEKHYQNGNVPRVQHYLAMYESRFGHDETSASWHAKLKRWLEASGGMGLEDALPSSSLDDSLAQSITGMGKLFAPTSPQTPGSFLDDLPNDIEFGLPISVTPPAEAPLPVTPEPPAGKTESADGLDRSFDMLGPAAVSSPVENPPDIAIPDEDEFQEWLKDAELQLADAPDLEEELAGVSVPPARGKEPPEEELLPVGLAGPLSFEEPAAPQARPDQYPKDLAPRLIFPDQPAEGTEEHLPGLEPLPPAPPPVEEAPLTESPGMEERLQPRRPQYSAHAPIPSRDPWRKWGMWIGGGALLLVAAGALFFLLRPTAGEEEVTAPSPESRPARVRHAPAPRPAAPVAAVPPASMEQDKTDAPPPPVVPSPKELDDQAFAAAEAARTSGAFESYLKRFPQGEHSAEAQGMLAEAIKGEEAVREAELQSRARRERRVICRRRYGELDAKGVEREAAGKGSGGMFETRTVEGSRVLVDFATGLMWRLDPSPAMDLAKAKWWANRRFAGYSDWRLPTVAEAMTLLAPGFPGFPDASAAPDFAIWTGDVEPSEKLAWVLELGRGARPEKSSRENRVAAVRPIAD